MRHAQFMAIGALGKGSCAQMIMCTTTIAPRLRMTSFWIRHLSTPAFRVAFYLASLFQPPLDFEQIIHMRAEFLFRTVTATGI